MVVTVRRDFTMSHHRTFEILTAEPVPSRRKPRHRSDEEKARLVAEAFSPGGNVSAVARSEGLDPSQLYAWRRKALSSGMVAPLTEAASKPFTQGWPLRTSFQIVGKSDPFLLSALHARMRFKTASVMVRIYRHRREWI